MTERGTNIRIYKIIKPHELFSLVFLNEDSKQLVVKVIAESQLEHLCG